MVDEGTTNDLTVRNRLQIPLGAPQTRKTGDIWYDANITSPGGTSGGGTTTRSITVHQESENEISMYDGSVLAASFSADNTINNITLDGKTIKIPKGVILGNMDGSDSINLEKNALNNAVRFTIKDKYIEDIADNRTALALVPVNNHITNIENDVLEKYGALKGMIDNNAELVETEIDETNRKINQTNSEISTQSSRIDSVIEDASLLRNLIDEDSSRISGLKNRITDLETVKTGIMSRLDEIDGENGSISSIETRLNALDSDETTSLKNQVVALRSSISTLSESVSTLSESLSSISEEIIEIKDTINSIHGRGTI